MTKECKQTIGICISGDILDFINERVNNKVFADVSHAFELMAFEYMKNLEVKDESTLEKIERLTMGTVKKSVEVVRETAETAMDTTKKAYHDSSEKVRDTPIGKSMINSAEKVQDTTMKAYEFSSSKVRESVGMVKERILPKDGDEGQEKEAKGKKIEIHE